MLLSLFENGFDKWSIISVLLALPVILFSLSLHETAHGWVAKKLGDPTAYNLGRLTLNPIKHLDPIGFICMLTVGFGWANPVPINTRYFKDPRKGMAICGIAGPISNLLLAIVCYIIKSFIAGFINFSQIFEINADGEIITYVTLFYVLYAIYLLFSIGVQLNLALAVFNMIPAPPFDGSRFLYAFLPVNTYFKVMKYERYIGLGIIILIFALSRLGIYPVSVVTDYIQSGLYYIIGKPIELLFYLIYG